MWGGETDVCSVQRCQGGETDGRSVQRCVVERRMCVVCRGVGWRDGRA